MTEDWLCSRVKLCPLITGPNVGLSTFQDPVEVIIISESYPQPHYNPSSILLTLEAFTGALDELQSRRSVVKVNYMDQNAPGPKPAQTDVIHHFAEMLTEDILDAAVRKKDSQSIKDCDLIHNITQGEASRWTMIEQEKLANRLVNEIYSNALEELARPAGRKSEERPDVIQTKQTYENEIVSEIHSEPASYLCTSIHHYNQEGSVMETDDRRSTSNPTTLDDMAHVGSLDYPDAPPSTPLLPEMMKSRSSFTRKLKGGLAKEFIPSTPPPTPREQQLLLGDRMTDSTIDKSEFVVGLMRSLSLACSQHGEDTGAINENRFHSEITDYAAQLSADIIHCITAVQAGNNRNIETPVREVQVLANHLAEEIIMTSITEVIKKRKAQGMSQEIPTYFENPTQVLNDTLLSETSQDIPPLDALRAMAGGLITNTLVQAFSELRSGPLQQVTSKQLPDPVSEAMPWEHENEQYLNTDSSIINSYQTYPNGCAHVKSEANYIPLDSVAAEHIFTENIVQEVLKFAIREASTGHLRCEETSVHSDGMSSSVPSQSVLRAFISETLRHDVMTQELQCVLLWAAASQMGTSTLQIDLNQNHIQQQLCSISLQAQFHDWTVGHLMMSLLQYCEDQQTASRGHSKISTSLLGHLLLTQS